MAVSAGMPFAHKQTRSLEQNRNPALVRPELNDRFLSAPDTRQPAPASLQPWPWKLSSGRAVKALGLPPSNVLSLHSSYCLLLLSFPALHCAPEDAGVHLPRRQSHPAAAPWICAA